MTTDERIQKLEQELYHAKRRVYISIIAVLLLAGIVVFDWGTDNEEVRANRFVVVDENGNKRAELGADEFGPALRLFDDKETQRATLLADENKSELSLQDKVGNGRAELVTRNDGHRFRFVSRDFPEQIVLLTYHDGPAAGSSIFIRSDIDAPEIHLGVGEESAWMGIYEVPSIPRARLYVDEKEVHIGGYDDAGTELWSAP